LEEVNMQQTKVVHPDKPETWETRGAVYKRLTRWAEDADWNGDPKKADALRQMAERYKEDQHEQNVPF
jgi:hypothetical protein